MHADTINFSRSNHVFRRLLFDIGLQVTMLAQKSEILSADCLRSRCAGLIEQLRKNMRDAEYDQALIEEASYAQCGLLDDIVVRYLSDIQQSEWQSAPLEMHFFNSSNAGYNIFVRINRLLLETNPSQERIALYDLVLRLGFRGRYADEDESERHKLILQLGRYTHSTVKPAALIKSKESYYSGCTAALRLLRWTALGIVFSIILWGAFSYQLTRSADRLQMLQPMTSVMSKED